MTLIGSARPGDPAGIVAGLPGDPTGLGDFGLVPGAPVSRRAKARGAVGSIFRTSGGAIGIIIVVGLIVLAIFGPELAPYSFSQINVNASFQGPSLHHLLGTDQLGRDLLSRLIF